MAPSPPSSPPRLVESVAAPPEAGFDAAARPPRRSWLLPLAIAAALVAAIGWGLEGRRAAELRARVAHLEGQVLAARVEISARQRHLESLRSAAAVVEQQVADFRALADRDPTVPAPEAAGPQ